MTIKEAVLKSLDEIQKPIGSFELCDYILSKKYVEFKRRLNIKVGETTNDGIFSLSCIRCVGACGLSPVVTIGEKVYGRVTPQQVRRIIDEYMMLEED
jgi:hypothetical protein